MEEKLKAAREQRNAALKRMQEAADAVDALPDDATEEQVTEADSALGEAESEFERTVANLARLERVAEARKQTPLLVADDDADDDPRITVGNEEPTYRPDKPKVSFLRDILASRNGDEGARERLTRNRQEALHKLDLEERDMTGASTQGAEFLPPLYLTELYVEPNIASRPFADALPKLPLAPTGVAVSIPQLSSGVTVAARAGGGAVSETDGVTATITHTVNEIAGQVDVDRVDVLRSDPSFDLILTRTLRRRYDSYLDTQLLAGTGTAPQHMGIRAVTGVNTVAYTDATPTAAELVPKIYDAIQKIASVRLEEFADLIVLHPRRAAWLASNLSSTFPLFQLGGLTQAAGTQAAGFMNSFSGLRIVYDANIATNYGASTNEDEIYVVASPDLILQEGPLMAKVYEEVGSGTGTVRYQVFSFSAFLSKRYPASITVISGTGLVVPVF